MPISTTASTSEEMIRTLESWPNLPEPTNWIRATVDNKAPSAPRPAPHRRSPRPVAAAPPPQHTLAHSVPNPTESWASPSRL
eukprot:CAMPEP_0181527182 /NCGR_PEP_ID=MMETSP1110-20121109/69874_1 /TAXON_ID=174948 /ORGANISM="Symbiodinium sp., Strain CCMP421" /LENGTH=81 /DNA_ID=CAMNT_0023658055 /DNA_START=547 /DNA_END=788 /DNA_ORIENTATION=+